MKSKLTIVSFFAFFLTNINAQTFLRAPVGDANFKDWKNISKVNNGVALVLLNQAVSYRYPDGKRYNKGFRVFNEGIADWSKYYGIRFDVFLKKDQPVDFDACFKVSEQDSNKFQQETHSLVRVSGMGWHEIVIPWSRFNIKEAQLYGALRVVKEFQILAKSDVDKTDFQLKNVELTHGATLSLTSKIKGKSAPQNSSVKYNVEVGNASNTAQSVNLKFDSRGWESMKASVTPASFDLKSGEVRECEVTVLVTDRLPEGSREKQTLWAIPNGRGGEAAKLEFTTASALSYPNILHTVERWKEVKDKVEKYDWAKKALAEYEKLAADWKVPEVATKITDDNTDKGMQLFQTQEEYNFMAAGIAYQLTGKKEYAEKVVLFMRRLSDPKKGYPSTFRACHQSFVQEGHFFQHIAMAYDMVMPSGVFTDADKAQIEQTFRLFYETVEIGMNDGGINNWKLSEMTGALYCALAIQDWNLAERMYSGTCGILDHFSQGVMNDGWWYECSVGYNVWCSSEFSQIALALEPWGVDFKNLRLPIGTARYYSLMPDFMRPGLYGMNFEKWGPVTKNSIGIKDMWDALPSFADYRGIMFGVNDAQETMVSGQPYELAYYMYRDPEYAAIIRRGTSRDLLYSVPELPESSSEKVEKSAYADNIGIVMLRSNTNNRPQREQIQAALHYGTHGGFHGHFDRTNLLNLTRYGRSFYNPEMIWYGYPSYMYKFFVQNSMTKNMVVVDQKMQEPVESQRTLFYTGKMMQATEVETNARWSNPPYGGMQYDWAGGISFAQKCWDEGRSIFIPINAPKYGEVTGFTEPVLQRRLMVVTDDYVVLADYLKAEKPHTFDWLFQMKGFKEINAPQKEFVRHDSQMNADPLGDAQFITDCNWYKTKGVTRSNFEMCWGKGCDNAGTRAPNSENGTLKINLFSVWPARNEIMVGTAPEPFDVNKQLWYTIETDGKILINDSTGVWILGNKQINVDLAGKLQLVLKTKVNRIDNPNIFWGDAKVVMKDGSSKYLSALNPKYVNILTPQSVGKDFQDGPVKIGGMPSENALSGMPSTKNEFGTVTIDLKGMGAVRFTANLGADFPLGNEASRRKTYAVRTLGNETVYLSVIEPFENVSVIKNIEAISENQFRVELTDGRVQEISITNLKHSTGQTNAQIREFKEGQLVREEKTDNIK
ncbi:MAG: alginate lyase family protein [Bacteroidota bacterium]|nr:alginate lyase family protein [Bacteroidota bacterium]